MTVGRGRGLRASPPASSRRDLAVPQGTWTENSHFELPCGKCGETIYKYERYFATFATNKMDLCESCASRMLKTPDAWRGDPTTKYQGTRIRKIQAKLGMHEDVPKTKGRASDLLGKLIAKEKEHDERRG